MSTVRNPGLCLYSAPIMCVCWRLVRFYWYLSRSIDVVGLLGFTSRLLYGGWGGGGAKTAFLKLSFLKLSFFAPGETLINAHAVPALC